MFSEVTRAPVKYSRPQKITGKTKKEPEADGEVQACIVANLFLSLAAICGLSNGLLTARLFVAQLLVAGRPHAERKCDLKLSYRLGLTFNKKFK